MKNIIVIAILVLATVSGAFAKEVKVKGYTKKDGTKVEGYTKTIKDKDADKDTVEVKGYTKKDGTKVAGYTRKKAK
ncbi:MAG: hypothetical protein JST89_20550 [Cyanobacteria bacterium SZAS-4]|nr:hypothetical protein [Cyanobacteria bacterium SZAS-4]